MTDAKPKAATDAGVPERLVNMNDSTPGYLGQQPTGDTADDAGAEQRDLDDIEEDEQAAPDTLSAPARHWMDRYLTGAINPFVRSGLDVIREHETISLAELCGLLAGREPMLSAFNQKCAARESQRLAELWKRKLIASNLAAEDGLRQSTRFGPSH